LQDPVILVFGAVLGVILFGFVSIAVLIFRGQRWVRRGLHRMQDGRYRWREDGLDHIVDVSPVQGGVWREDGTWHPGTGPGTKHRTRTAQANRRMFRRAIQSKRR